MDFTKKIFRYIGLIISLVFILTFLLSLAIKLCVFYIPFHRDVVVIDKFCGSEDEKFIVDDRGRAYKISDSKFLGFFKSSELFGSLDIGKRYHISGKGVRIPFLISYPSITHVSLLIVLRKNGLKQ